LIGASPLEANDPTPHADDPVLLQEQAGAADGIERRRKIGDRNELIDQR
jgi:hypothetical protein